MLSVFQKWGDGEGGGEINTSSWSWLDGVCAFFSTWLVVEAVYWKIVQIWVIPGPLIISWTEPTPFQLISEVLKMLNFFEAERKVQRGWHRSVGSLPPLEQSPWVQESNITTPPFACQSAWVRVLQQLWGQREVSGDGTGAACLVWWWHLLAVGVSKIQFSEIKWTLYSLF